MAQKVYSVASQKGGEGKSAIAYGLAERLAPSGRTLLCDTDHPQYSIKLLAALREQHGGGPLPFDIAACRDRGEVGRKSKGYDYVVIDGAPHASHDTYHYAQHSDVVILPTRPPILDLSPNIELARSLEARGIPRDRMVFVITQSPSKSESASARSILEADGWAVLDQDLHFKQSYSAVGDIGRSLNDVKHRGLRYKVDCLMGELLRR